MLVRIIDWQCDNGAIKGYLHSLTQSMRVISVFLNSNLLEEFSRTVLKQRVTKLAVTFKAIFKFVT